MEAEEGSVHEDQGGQEVQEDEEESEEEEEVEAEGKVDENEFCTQSWVPFSLKNIALYIYVVKGSCFHSNVTKRIEKLKKRNSLVHHVLKNLFSDELNVVSRLWLDEPFQDNLHIIMTMLQIE